MKFPSRYLGTELDRRYRLDRWIGEGASAWVFAAHDLRLDRAVAVKVWKASVVTPGSDRGRFIREGRLLAKLDHAHVVAVHDSDETPDGLAYLVMELSDGWTLEAELARRVRLPPEEVVNLLLPLLGAVAYAHDLGITHRDVKPANIVLAHQYGERRAKLLDFGIAGTRDSHGPALALGTPAYMAPEQIRGEPLGFAVDVWAMGVVFFRALSGRLPFDGDTTSTLLLKITTEQPPRFAYACPGLSPRVAIALDRALVPCAAQRFQTMRDFARALAEACTLDGVSVPKRPDPLGLPDFGKWCAGADVQETQPVSQREQDPRDVPAERRSVAGRGTWLGAAAACVAAALLVFSLGTADSVSSCEQRRVPSHAMNQPARISSQTKEQPQTTGIPLPQAVPSPPLPIPTMGRRTGWQRRKAPPSASSAPTPVAVEVDAEPPSAEDARRRGQIVMTWDW